MFESVCIRRQRPLDSSQPLDLGLLAEALVFYQNVHLVVDQLMLTQLVRACGPRVVMELITEELLKVSYVDRTTGIQNEGVGTPNEKHRPVTAYVTDTYQQSNEWRLEKVAPEIFAKIGGGPGWGRQMGRRFAELVPTLPIPTEVVAATSADFLDIQYVADAIEGLLGELAPTYRLPQDFRFEIQPDGEWFRIETDIDFEQANASYNQRAGTTGMNLTAPTMLTYLLEARAELHFAAQTGGELATHPANAAVIDAKWREILRVRDASDRNIQAFQEAVLPGAHEIGESITSGLRTWGDLLTLLTDKETRKWKEWLSRERSDTALVREYIKQLQKTSWVSSPQGKVLRLLVFTGLGLLTNVAVSMGLSLADSFLVDRARLNWTPNQFVNGPLKRFARID